MICTIYSHELVFDRITDLIKKNYPKGILTFARQDDFDIAELEIKGGLFSGSKKIKMSYRQRAKPSYHFPEINDSPLTANLKGLYGFVSSLPAKNETVRDLFLQKIKTLNCEFSVIQEQGETKEIKTLIQNFAGEFDAILFVQPNTVISKADGQHFLDRNLNLIIDTQGNCEIDSLDIKINSAYFDNQAALSEDQNVRKANSEKVLASKNIKVNANLPCIASESETTIRSPKEIAQRVSVLAVTNFVAFNSLSGEQATNYLKSHGLWDFVTPNEKVFLANPTDEKKSNETWKCEGIWTLMWALNKVDNLGFPDELCNLGNIAPEAYPVGPGKDPKGFIDSITEARPKREILDENDLYYRFEWACVDARISNKQINGINPGVVYERHYALNWLINYMGQDWDDVSCDT